MTQLPASAFADFCPVGDCSGSFSIFPKFAENLSPFSVETALKSPACHSFVGGKIAAEWEKNHSGKQMQKQIAIGKNQNSGFFKEPEYDLFSRH